MSDHHLFSDRPKRRPWFALLVALVTIAGASIWLQSLVDIAGNAWALYQGGEREHWDGAAFGAAWPLLAGVRLAAFGFAGYVSASVSAPSRLLTALLVLLAVAAALFEQLPVSGGLAGLVLWQLSGPCALWAGARLAWRGVK